ncbi:hypothetical protein FNX24_21760 [Salmonella enterica]|nr:hypothetical protein [Salmonella enterica]
MAIICWPCCAASPVTGRNAAANAQYGAATRRRAAVPARRRAAPTAHSVGDVRRRRGGERVYGLSGRGAGLAVWSLPRPVLPLSIAASCR